MTIWNILAAFFSGAAGAMGLGGGGVLVLYLTLALHQEQLMAQGINLLFFLPCAVISILIHAKKKMIQWNTVCWMALGGIAGVALGMYLTKVVSTGMMAKLFGLFLLAVGTMELFGKAKTEKRTKEAP